jgi:hypothetical protein
MHTTTLDSIGTTIMTMTDNMLCANFGIDLSSNLT